MDGVLFQIRWSRKALLGRVHIYEDFQEVREDVRGNNVPAAGIISAEARGRQFEEQQRGQRSWSRKSRRVSSRSEIREASRSFTERERGNLWRVE